MRLKVPSFLILLVLLPRNNNKDVKYLFFLASIHVQRSNNIALEGSLLRFPPKLRRKGQNPILGIGSFYPGDYSQTFCKFKVSSFFLSTPSFFPFIFLFKNISTWKFKNAIFIYWLKILQTRRIRDLCTLTPKWISIYITILFQKLYNSMS